MQAADVRGEGGSVIAGQADLEWGAAEGQSHLRVLGTPWGCGGAWQ